MASLFGMEAPPQRQAPHQHEFRHQLPEPCQVRRLPLPPPRLARQPRTPPARRALPRLAQCPPLLPRLAQRALPRPPLRPHRLYRRLARTLPRPPLRARGLIRRFPRCCRVLFGASELSIAGRPQGSGPPGWLAWMERFLTPTSGYRPARVSPHFPRCRARAGVPPTRGFGSCSLAIR